MMPTLKPQQPVEEIIKEAGDVFSAAEGIDGLLGPDFPHRVFFKKIPEHIRTERLKISVVGVIKSGKSTFVNALLGREIVKRGAGVVTAITTRIQKGKKNQACLYLKSWDDINARLRKQLALIPDDRLQNGVAENFDIRRKNDREILGKIYQTLIDSISLKNEVLHPEILSIRHALQGYDAVKDRILPDETVLHLESKEFEKHKEYTGDPDKAFYIKDVCLYVPAKNLSPHIELADCQGADSTDPSQLSKILTYLEFSNLIIYCISSRTGLRESDMVFLKRIKNLGLLENILFINNCDLGEHESLDDLLRVEAGIRENLSLLGITPVLYSFSLLFGHFSNLKSKLSKKDLFRFESWQNEKEMVEYCLQGNQAFKLQFNDKIEKYRHELLVSNHMKRLFILLCDLNSRVDIFLDLLSSNTLKEEKARKTALDFYQNACRFETIVAHSLENAVQVLKKEISADIHQMFHKDRDAVLTDLLEYVQMLSIEAEPDTVNGREAGFNTALFLMSKEFHRRVEIYVLEAVNPLLRKFINLQENRIKSFFQSYGESCRVTGLPVDPHFDAESIPLPENNNRVTFDAGDMDEIKGILGIKVPDKVVEAQYTPKIKTRVIAEVGLKAFWQVFSSFFDKQPRLAPALKNAAAKMKKENHGIFKKQFEEYGADLKNHYLFPLIDAAARSFREKANERLKQYEAFNAKADHLFSLKHSEKEDQKTKVYLLKNRIDSLIGVINAYGVF